MSFSKKFSHSSMLVLALGGALLGGCSASQADGEDDGVDTGEEAIVGTVLGSQTGSAYTTPNGRYYAKRELRTLGLLVDSATNTVLTRADGVIANQSPDGLVSLAELVRLEDPSFFKFLTSSEKAALPLAWKALQAPTNKPAAGLAAPSMAWPPKVVIDEEAPRMDPKEGVAITKLPGDPAALKRLELGYDADGDPTTVSLQDCIDGLGAPGPFSPNEVATFKIVETHLRDNLVARGRISATVPKPTTEKKTLSPLAGVTISVVRDFAYYEHRNLTRDLTSSARNRLLESLTATQYERVQVSLPQGVTVVTVRVSSGIATANVLNDASGSRWGGAGTADVTAEVLEVWQNGKRLGARALPTLNQTPPSLDLSHLADVPLKVGSTTLSRNARFGVATKTFTAVGFLHELKAAAPSDGATTELIDAVALPTTTLKAGIYDLAKGQPASSGKLIVYGPTIVAWSAPNAKPSLAQGRRWSTLLPSGTIPIRGAGPSSEKTYGLDGGFFYESYKGLNGEERFAEQFFVQPRWRETTP